MKNTLAFLLMIVSAFLLAHYMPAPWWGGFVLTVLISFVFKIRSGGSFLLGFVAFALLWGGMALYIHQSNQGLLADMIGGVFQLNGWGMIGLTTLLGGILGGLSAWTGSLGRQLFVQSSHSNTPDHKATETNIAST